MTSYHVSHEPSKDFWRTFTFKFTAYISKYEFLSPLLCGFRKGISTQHALLNLIQNCQKYLDNSGHIGCVLMDLSKAYDCIDHELLLAKLAAYGLGN